MFLRSGKYYRSAHEPEGRNIIIFDLDHTLIHSIKTDISKYLTSCGFNLNNKHYVIIKRPYIENLISYCYDNYDNIIVWSSGIRDYVDEVVRNIFPSDKQPTFVLARENCTNHNGKHYKDFNNVRHIFVNHGINIDKSNIIFLEDKPDIVLNLPFDNGLVLPVDKFKTRHYEDIKRGKRKRYQPDRDNHLHYIIKQI